MFRRLFHVILGWYVIWFLVGLAVMAIPYDSPVGHWEDLLFMLLASAVIFLDATRRIGWGVAGIIFLWVTLVSGAIELLGAMTGFPFGDYAYTEKFGPQIMGLPWAIPLAWWVVIYPLIMLTSTLVREGVLRPRFAPIAVALAATAVDVALEPAATKVRDYWFWVGGGAYYEVPWTNFVGWFGTALLIVIPVQYYCARPLRENYTAPGAIFLPLAVLGSVLTTFLVSSLVHELWLASAWIVVLILIIIFCIIRLAWPRREVFMLDQMGRYRKYSDRPNIRC